MTEAAPRRWTTEEFFAWQELQPDRYELVDGFPLRLMAKDVRTADDLAHALGIPAPLADLCAKLWDDAAMGLAETADHTEIIRYLERLE